MFEEDSSSFSIPYLFNGKELDRETNLSYFGARYYDSKTSLWLSVDPLAEKYPNYSGYSYCFYNPLKFVDPDGRDPHPSKDFLNSAYGKIYTYLAKNNSAFKKMFSKYNNSKKFNTYYIIDDKAVAKLGNAAAFTVSKPTKEGGIKSIATFPSDGSVSDDYEYNDLY